MGACTLATKLPKQRLAAKRKGLRRRRAPATSVIEQPCTASAAAQQPLHAVRASSNDRPIGAPTGGPIATIHTQPPKRNGDPLGLTPWSTRCFSPAAEFPQRRLRPQKACSYIRRNRAGPGRNMPASGANFHCTGAVPGTPHWVLTACLKESRENGKSNRHRPRNHQFLRRRHGRQGPKVIENAEGRAHDPSIVAFTGDGERLVGQPASARRSPIPKTPSSRSSA